MTKVKRSNDCGNSPKNLFIEEMEIAFAQGNREFLANAVTLDIHWTIIGQKAAHGIDEFLALLQETVQRAEVLEIAIHHVVTHGKAGAVNGVRQENDGKTYDFCTVYEFGNAKGTSIREVSHYAIARI
ncbi:MAG: nuclear transport factor 2 family protein [Caldilinea sp. CFX5]|nr:nuclear transport factor 2 family protein [Caldilinea sp. CFX5]